MIGLLGTLMGLGGAVGKIISGVSQNSKANKIHPEYVPYETSQYAKNQLGLAQTLFNGRMFGANDLEKNIFASGANTLSSINRNATDGSQALMGAIAAQGQTNNALQNLQIQEKQNKYGLLDNLNDALAGMTREGDKVYQDKLTKFKIDADQKYALKTSAWQNIFGGVSDIAGGLIQGDTAGLFSKFGDKGDYFKYPYAADYSTVDIPDNDFNYNPGLVSSDMLNRSNPSFSINTRPYGMIGARPY